MESMTGYAAINSKTPQFSFTMSIKSLNSKYNEFFINLPKFLRSYENDFLIIIKDAIRRGKVEFNIDNIEWNKSRSLDININLLHKYCEELSKVERNINDGRKFSLDSILSLEGVLQRERTVIIEKSEQLIIKCCKDTLQKLIKMRLMEGRSIEKDISKSLNEISKGINKIKKLSRNNNKIQYNKLKNRIEKILDNKIDDIRLYSEVAILVDKLDINEEISRLTDHIKKFKQSMRKKEQIGKKLDFIAQEMFREINTITSKSSSSEIAHFSVDIKNNIDKIREQCRNII